MAWPFDKKEPTVPDPQVGDDKDKKPEKTPAELIAESLSSGLKPVTDTLTALSARLDSIENNTKKPAPKVDPADITSVLDDENAAFAQRMTPLLLRQLELEARIVKNDIKAEYASAGYGDLWTQYESEIAQTLDNTPVVTAEGKPFRGDPSYIRNVVDMVMGRAARKAGMRFDGKAKGFFLETAGSGDGTTHQPEADGLSDSQRKLMGRMKISTEDAKKVLAKLKFVGA